MDSYLLVLLFNKFPVLPVSIKKGMINDNNNNLAKVYLNIKEKEKIIKGYWCLELGFFLLLLSFSV